MPVFLSLVEYLRQRGLVGTKIGCAQGDCAGHARSWPAPLRVRPFAIRTLVSCIQPLHRLDGTHIVTVEGVSSPRDSQPDPASDGRVPWVAMHGFCTPGFVTSLTRLFECDNPIDDDTLRTNLAGATCARVRVMSRSLRPVCRSTTCAKIRPLSSLYPSQVMVEELAACALDSILITTADRVLFRPTPARLDEAVVFRAATPAAVITARQHRGSGWSGIRKGSRTVGDLEPRGH